MGNTAASALLQRLFEMWQKSANKDQTFSRPITKKMAKEYFATTTFHDKDKLHARLKTAEASGCITLTWSKQAANNVLERITLKDPIKLAEFLAVPLASEQAAEARRRIDMHVQTEFAWITTIKEDLLAAWQHGKSRHGLGVADVIKAINVLNALDAVSQGCHRGHDLRSFSVTYLDNSKTMESIKGIFRTLWQHHHGGDLEVQELYESLGLVKFAQPVFLQTQGTVKLNNTQIDCCHIKPYIGLAPQSINDIEFASPPAYVLTIENLASFNRYCDEIADGGLILYSNGFPSPDFGDLIRLLHHKFDASVLFYHWGDVDLGGLRIFCHIQSFLLGGNGRRTLHPHLMNKEYIMAHGRPQPKLRRSQFANVVERCPQSESIVEAIFATGNPLVFEQEALAPASPDKTQDNARHLNGNDGLWL